MEGACLDEYELFGCEGIVGSFRPPHPIHSTCQDEGKSLTDTWDEQNLAQSPGPHQSQATKMYSGLRKNLVDTVYNSWTETGFAWEQYNGETGKGQRTQHFTGWTSLVVKVMGMPDLSGGKGRGHEEL